DTQAEPDTLVASHRSTFVRDLTVHDGELYGLIYMNGESALIGLDPVTGQGFATVRLPLELREEDIRGIESANGAMWLLVGEAPSFRLVELAMP
ncbi:MAG: hypothetical protein AAF602_18475, partial [Myxococcota bacterium]